MTNCKICGFDHKIYPGAGKSAHSLRLAKILKDKKDNEFFFIDESSRSNFGKISNKQTILALNYYDKIRNKINKND